ncbi:gfo/Idh/MocA family oxidoreductase [Clavibacter lycopersici]|uniref:Gfo/Idh/MocA family oxidoreductase n=1 Tax=Clavibacter lycopersici TaxID=2301718 RepID=A0A399TBJ8_9MICO|nr:Gfo/Idh/MocA family oxidoreductase [Clavibacter lycopersici]RIJ51481.1 gfo/Idh/MocA family oxidoreductase [Clavibacter lycopersici]RIJ62452.1 gfo/Idh/MocA family oxidoreductase [Clavibacter lycopersici]
MSTTMPPTSAPASEEARPIRFGVIGAAGIATSVVPDMQLVPGVEVVAVHSRTRSSSEQLASACGIPRIHDTLEALLADPEVDAVYVATPHTLHRAQAEAALRAGKHVVCEKPATTTAADTRALVDLARAEGLLFLEALWMAFSPGYLAVREAIADGRVGDPRTIAVAFGFVTEEGQGRLWDPEVGGGTLLDMGVYPLAFAHGLFGAPSTVAAVGTVIDGGVDTEVAILLGWPDGRQATLACSLVAALPTGATVSGTAGRMDVDPLFLASTGLTIVPADGDPERREHEIEGRGYVPMFRAARDAIRAGDVECAEMPHAASVDLAELMDGILAEIGAR